MEVILNQDPTDVNWFSQSGVAPRDLEYVLAGGQANRSLATNIKTSRRGGPTITFASPTAGTVVVPGQTIQVTADGSTDVLNLLFVSSSGGSPHSFEVAEGNAISFDYQVPIEAIGQIRMVAP